MPDEANGAEVILRVKSSSSATSLASAISHGIYDGKTVMLRAIGAGAVNQAVKAVAIARSFVAARGIDLSIRPGFTTVEMPDRDNVTAMLFRVIQS
jgi:stage V sporulation protein S